MNPLLCAVTGVGTGLILRVLRGRVIASIERNVGLAIDQRTREGDGIAIALRPLKPIVQRAVFLTLEEYIP